MLASAPAIATERSYIVSDFDRIRVEGPYLVVVETGKSARARVSGSVDAIERVSVSVQTRMLIIRPFHAGWGGSRGVDPEPVTIRVATPALLTAGLQGSGTLLISAMRAARINIALSGSGTLAVDAVDADQLGLDLQGAGELRVAGKALSATVATSGSGRVKAINLSIVDLKMVTQSSGQTDIAAKRTAKITASGSGNVTIIGAPACTVTSIGTGTVSCGVAR